uniref:hypothetical protein n=1 Tax=Arthrobacter sp. CAL618 TaxID=1055770 RepID=UPI0005565DD6
PAVNLTPSSVPAVNVPSTINREDPVNRSGLIITASDVACTTAVIADCSWTAVDTGPEVRAARLAEAGAQTRVAMASGTTQGTATRLTLPEARQPITLQRASVANTTAPSRAEEASSRVTPAAVIHATAAAGNNRKSR